MSLSRTEKIQVNRDHILNRPENRLLRALAASLDKEDVLLAEAEAMATEVEDANEIRRADRQRIEAEQAAAPEEPAVDEETRDARTLAREHIQAQRAEAADDAEET